MVVESFLYSLNTVVCPEFQWDIGVCITIIIQYYCYLEICRCILIYVIHIPTYIAVYRICIPWPNKDGSCLCFQELDRLLIVLH